MTALSFNRATLHERYRAGASAMAVVDDAFQRLAAANDPGIFLHVLAPGRVTLAQALPPFDPSRYPLWGLPFAFNDNIGARTIPTGRFARGAYADRPRELGPRACGAWPALLSTIGGAPDLASRKES